MHYIQQHSRRHLGYPMLPAKLYRAYRYTADWLTPSCHLLLLFRGDKTKKNKSQRTPQGNGTNSTTTNRNGGTHHAIDAYYPSELHHAVQCTMEPQASGITHKSLRKTCNNISRAYHHAAALQALLRVYPLTHSPTHPPTPFTGGGTLFYLELNRAIYNTP